MNKTHYLVSGYARSGTSMMTRCLDLGGIPAYYDREHQVKPGTNKYGSYEVPLSESKSLEAHRTKWASLFQHPGECVKALLQKIQYIPDEGHYKVVLMLRDPAAIYASYMRAWGDAYSEVMKDANKIKDPHDYWVLVEDARGFLGARPNTDLVELSYEGVVDHPVTAFTMLKKNGWPIDVGKAAAGVEPGEKHF